MKSLAIKLSLVVFAISMTLNVCAQDFQGQAIYVSKSTMDLGNWGKRLSEAQKKQVMANLKNRLEKTYILNFNKEESFFKEGDKLDAISGATDSWGKNFVVGDQYKNVKTNTQIQDQEFYGKRFLVKDKLQPIQWVMGTETKQIGSYTCFKATTSIPTDELTWYSFSWDKLSRANTTETAEGETIEPEIPITEVEAWYAPQIPVGHGPLEFWGLPGLILEVSAGDTTMLCTKLVLNPEDKLEIKAPDKGKETTKAVYQKTLINKMKEFRDNRMGRGRR